MKTLRKLYQRYFGVAESAAVVSKKPAYYYEVYEDPAYGPVGKFLGYNLTVFSWYNETHTEGKVESFKSREVALLVRDTWLEDMRIKRNIVVPVGAA